MVRVASLCTGVAGLDLGATMAYAAAGRTVEHIWYSELDPDACTVLNVRLPGVPNIGDLTVADWAALPRPDVLTAGFPCQPVSSAGQQKAQKDKRWLWPHVRKAIQVLRPQEVILENVRNLVSIQKGQVFADILADLRADGYAVRWAIAGACAIGSCHHRHRVFVVARYAWQLNAPAAEQIPVNACGARRGKARQLLPTPTAARYGNNQGGARPGGPVRHSLDQAQHLFPTPTSSDGKGGPGCPGRDGGDNLRTAVVELPAPDGRTDNGVYTPGSRYADRRAGDPAGEPVLGLLPTPRATDTGTPGRRASEGFRPPLSQVIHAEQQLLPTPIATDGQGGPRAVPQTRTSHGPDHGPRLRDVGAALGELLPTPCARDFKVGYDTDRQRPNGDTLPDVAQQHLTGDQIALPWTLLPTPRYTDAANGSPNQHGGRGLSDLMLPSAVIGARYGRYAPAVALWQDVSGLAAPAPTMLNPAGQWRLDPRLPEWMLGFPPGWITDIVGRLPALRLAGNAVVAQLLAALYPFLTADWPYLQGGDLCPDNLAETRPDPRGTASPAPPARLALPAGPPSVSAGTPTRADPPGPAVQLALL